MVTVSIIGNGNVSHHLQLAIAKTKSVRLLEVLSGRPAQITLKDEPQIVLIAVSDDAIATVANKLRNTNCLIAHTSGAADISVLPKNKRIGVFYPLQTFSKNTALNFKNIPICIEATSQNDLDILMKLGKLLSDNVQEISSKQRTYLHVAAVLVNNFSNHLFSIADEVCSKNNVPFSLLTPLIEETVSKIKTISPTDAQTGPAKRGDQNTIDKHLNLLTTDMHKKVYTVLSKSIQNTYDKKL